MKPRSGACADLTSVRDAVGNAHTAKAAAGQEQSRMSRGQRAVDRGHTIQVADVVLRVPARPAVHPREQRVAVDAEKRPQRP